MADEPKTEIHLDEVSNINEFAQQFTGELDAYIRAKLPESMSNEAYARATAAMLVSLSRATATCAVAFGKTHGVTRNFVSTMLSRQLSDNLVIAYDALDQAQAEQQAHGRVN